MQWYELIDLAQEAWYQRNLGKSEQLLRQALELLEPCGNSDARLLPNLELLTELLLKQEKILAAEPLLHRLLDAQTHQPNVGKLAIAKTLQRLADVSYYQLFYSRAISFGLRRLTALTELLGNNREEIADATHKLAIYCRAAGNYEQSEFYYKQSINIVARSGDGDKSGLLLRSYASFLQAMHRDEEAEHLMFCASAVAVSA